MKSFLKIIIKNRKIVALVIALAFTFATSILATFAWYTSSSNDTNATTDEIRTLVQGYGGHFSSEEEHSSFSEIYESGSGISTKALVKPGDVIYYAFLFDVDKEEGLKRDYSLDIVLNASGETGEYHNVEYGNYNDLLTHIGIEANSCELYQLQKTLVEPDVDPENPEDDQKEYKYVTFGEKYVSPSFTNTEIRSFYNNGSFNTTITLKMPTNITYPSDEEERGYFMIYIPIWYMDTEELQNTELECYVKVSSTIITEITQN